MQINSDLGSQIPALLAVLKIAHRSAGFNHPIDPRSWGRSSRRSASPAASWTCLPQRVCDGAASTALSSTPADPLLLQAG